MRENRVKMDWGFKRADGTELSKVRISNSTFIDYVQNLYIEDNVFISHFCNLEASNKIIIREGCQIASHVVMTTHSSHVSVRLYGEDYTKYSSPKGYIAGSIEIGKYSFIGAHSLFMPNTKIGKGSVVSAYSYVQGEFPDFSRIKGNPAKRIGDTRKIDKKYLAKHPELIPLYKKWADED